jgi:hypothetical protein
MIHVGIAFSFFFLIGYCGFLFFFSGHFDDFVFFVSSSRSSDEGKKLEC